MVDGEGARIQRFSPKGDFERLWGQNVFGRDEKQFISVNPASVEPNLTLGTVTLSFGGYTTSPITVVSESNDEVRANSLRSELAALPSIGASNIKISGSLSGGYTVRFLGALGGTDVSQIVVDNTQLNGTNMSVSTLENGAGGSFAGFEICTTAVHCREGETTGTTANGGQLNEPQGVAINQSTGDVYVTEQGNRRVSEFDADGNFLRAWGWDVIASGEPNDAGTGFEICTVASECQQGAEGANGGELGGSVGYPVTDSSNNVWVPDAANRRIQEFSASGSFIAAYGYDVSHGGAFEKCTSTALNACEAGMSGSAPGSFSNQSPTRIAFDSSGNLYAIDAGNNRVQEFNTTGPSVVTPTFAASLFSAYTTQAPDGVISSQGGARLDFSIDNDVTVSPIGEHQIVELDPTDIGSVKDTSLVGAGLTDITGLAASDTTGNLYATTTSSASPRGVLVLGTTLPTPPVPTLDSVATKTDTTATLSATVDPKGGLVSCRFEYSTDQNNWTDVVAPQCKDLVPAGGAQAVGVNLIGLHPNTHYFARFAVSRALVPNSTVFSFIRPLDTDSVPPVISDFGAIQITDTSARLVGTIDPRNSQTGYAFQYGTTPGLGSSTTPLGIGSGITPVTVSQVVGGLSPDTTYYFKLVATNTTGATASPSKTFHTRAEPLPPASSANCPNEAERTAQQATLLAECRAYEMVSPTDKNQGGVGMQGHIHAALSRDGQAVTFCAGSLFGEPPAQQTFLCAGYLSRRGPDGWIATDPFPRICNVDPTGVLKQGLFNVFLSPQSFNRAALEVPESASCPFSPLDPAAPLPSKNLYREDLTSDPASYQLLAPNPSSYERPTGEFAGGDDDFSHGVYVSYTNQTPDSPPQEMFHKVYDWEEDGQGGCSLPGGCLSLISKDTSDNAFTTNSGLPGFIKGGSGTPLNPISRDGRRIYFQNQTFSPSDEWYGACIEAICDLYMREDDATTFHVSASECTAECGTDSSPAQFIWANPSGEKALFLSCAKLTDESAPGTTCHEVQTFRSGAHAKLYRWDRAGAPGHRLFDLTADHEPADGSQPDAVGLIGGSDDGNTIFLVAAGQIVSGAPTDPGLKLYRWRWNGGSPTVDYLGPYLSTKVNGTNENNVFGTGTLNILDDPNANREHIRVTPDGKYLVIQTRLRLDPAADRDSDSDLYRWDEANGWLCVSCQLPGIPSAGPVDSSMTLPPDNAVIHELVSLEADQTPSDDGKHIFFETPDALVPQDVNGETGCPTFYDDGAHDRLYNCEDVYEWHDGTVSLISSGTGSGPAILIGASHTGDDVFFATAQRLVGWDADTSLDIYDARVGGGFPEPPPQPAGCEGEACRGEGSVASGAAGAGTAAFQGPGNPPPKHQGGRKHHKKRRHHKRATHHRPANHNRRAGR